MAESPARRRIGIIFVASGLLMGLLVLASAQSLGRAASQSPIQRTYTTVWFERGTSARLARTLAVRADRLATEISRNFGTTPRRLYTRLYTSHRSFSRALWALQRQRPQTAVDNSSSIVRGTLLLGPLPRSYLWHNLAHVYTEWVVDRLIANSSDTLPSNTWLYDGLAEYEAYRYEPSGMRCSVGAAPSFDVTQIRRARQWLEIRGGPLGSLEYCLAYSRVRSLVSGLGWSCVVHALRQPGSWSDLPQRLIAADRSTRQRGALCGTVKPELPTHTDP